VTATLHFAYSGSSINLQTISLPEPFNSWYVPSVDFTTIRYPLAASGSSEGTADLVFNIPNATETSYVGDFVVTAKDAFGATLTSTATITAGLAQTENFGFLGWIMANPLVAVAVVVVVLVIILYLALKKR
jgi:hypothetical protein